MGIQQEEIHIIHNMSSKEINKFMRRECHRYSDYAFKGMRVFIFVYCAGHGVADQQ